MPSLFDLSYIALVRENECAAPKMLNHWLLPSVPHIDTRIHEMHTFTLQINSKKVHCNKEPVSHFFFESNCCNTTLKNFVLDAKINGSEQQKVLEDFKVISSKFKFVRDIRMNKSGQQADILK